LWWGVGVFVCSVNGTCPALRDTWNGACCMGTVLGLSLVICFHRGSQVQVVARCKSLTRFPIIPISTATEDTEIFNQAF
jgi:hypothetical protein